MTTHKLVFDLKADRDVYWCTADIGWVTGHSYIVYGPLPTARPASSMRARPTFPTKIVSGRSSSATASTILYTAPTAIRTFMKWGTEYPAKHDLSSLRLLGTVGEPINPEAWIWYREWIGGESRSGRRYVVADRDRRHHDLAAARAHDAAAGKRDAAVPGHRGRHRQRRAARRAARRRRLRVLTRPWPGMLRGIWGDDERYVQTYWSKFPHFYFAGDGARRDGDGNFWFMGRIDDVMNVSGHRISTTEVESALVDHPAVAEAAVCGKLDDMTGQAIYAFVSLKGTAAGSAELADELRDHVGAQARKVHPPEIRDVHRKNFPKRAAARSCAACSATSPRGARSATPRRWPTRRSSRSCRSAPRSRSPRTTEFL